jgi:glycosyltransferase involved in cell wall biosynthesis
MSVAVLVPVLGRPHTIAPVLESICATTPSAHVVFVGTTGDDEALAAVRDAAAGASHVDLIVMRPNRVGDYAKKINHAAATVDDDMFFLAASDLRFHDGWFEAIERQLTPGVGVIGTNDLGNRRVTDGYHSTHSAVTRWYMEEFGTIDEPGKILHEGYVHEFVDDELVGTAKYRAMYVWAGDSLVEHLHPLWGKAKQDEMYRRSNFRMRASRSLYNQRRKLWM